MRTRTLPMPTLLAHTRTQVPRFSAQVPRFSDMLWSDSLRMQKGKSAKFGYFPMMTVATLGVLNAESFCECVLSCVKMVVSDLHVSPKAEEIHMLVMLRMNREFMEYMRTSYGCIASSDTPLSEFKTGDT